MSRAGAHLAARLLAVRAEERKHVVDPGDEEDLLAERVVRWWRDEHLAAMFAVHRAVLRLAPPLELGDVRRHDVSHRAKRLPTIIDKLTRESVKLADLVDLGGVRAVLESQEVVDALVERLRGELEVRRVRDWARNPRSSGYRAVHLHSRYAGRMIEIQLRTLRRSEGVAEVEDLGTDQQAAMEIYERLEAEYLENDDVVVVLIGSQSLETLKGTHSSYFGAPERIVSRYSAASSS